MILISACIFIYIVLMYGEYVADVRNESGQIQIYKAEANTAHHLVDELNSGNKEKVINILTQKEELYNFLEKDTNDNINKINFFYYLRDTIVFKIKLATSKFGKTSSESESTSK